MTTTLINPYDPENAGQMSLFGDDERKFAREQSRKRKPKVEAPTVIADGPCCGRCHHWKAPTKGNDYGICGVIVIVSNRPKGCVSCPEKGAAIELDNAEGIADIEWEFMRTSAAFGATVNEIPACTSFEEREWEQAA